MADMAQAIHRPPKTIEDYRALPDEVRAELIEGELYVTPAPTFEHQRVSFALARALFKQVEERGVGWVCMAPLDVHLPTGDVVQPDVFVVRRERAAIVRDQVHGAPDLAVEVLSRSHAERDRIVKRDVYHRSGVPEYWIVDPVARSIEVFRLDRDRYVPAGWFHGDATLSSPTFEGLGIDLRTIFR